MTTLPPSAEALLADLADIQETRYDVAFRWVSDALAKVITEATAQQAAEVARLLDGLLDGPLLHLDHEHPGWAAQTIRAALAQPAVAPNPPAPGHRALIDRARANHVRWQHEAEVLEECTRTLCLGAKVLLWPNPDDPDFQPEPAP